MLQSIFVNKALQPFNMNNLAFCRYFGALNVGLTFLLFGGTLAHAQNDIVYVSDPGAGTVSEIDSSGNETTIASGLNSPEGVAIDSSGNLYVANQGDGTVSEINSAGNVSTFASGLNSPTALTFDPSGNLYVANSPPWMWPNLGTGTITKINSSGNASVFATGFTFAFPYGEFLTSDNAGNIYVNNIAQGYQSIQKIDPLGNQSIFQIDTLDYDFLGLAFDGAGNYYFAKTDGNTGGILGTGNLSQFNSINWASYISTLPYPYNNGIEYFDHPQELVFDQNGNLFASFLNLSTNDFGASYEGVNDVIVEFNTNGTDSIIATDTGGVYFAVESVPEPGILTLVSGLAAIWYIRSRSAAIRPLSTRAVRSAKIR
jgi:hypothetical protein